VEAAALPRRQVNVEPDHANTWDDRPRGGYI